MKIQLSLLFTGILISYSGFAFSQIAPSTERQPIYRDTRLGSSSPLYNTYEKNDDGAGAITTNPDKGQGSGGTQLLAHQNISTGANTTQAFYRDTRLGSSSPLYNTYKKNDDGAGAITTNPNKGEGSGGTHFIAHHAVSSGSHTAQKSYRDNRMGSSSPLYNTYRKNDYGAGSISTNPNKG